MALSMSLAAALGTMYKSQSLSRQKSMNFRKDTSTAYIINPIYNMGIKPDIELLVISVRFR